METPTPLTAFSARLASALPQLFARPPVGGDRPEPMLVLPRQQRWTVRLCAVLALWLAVAAAGTAQSPGTDVAPRMRALLAESGMVGASWMLLDGDGVVVTGAAGLRQAGTAVPLTADDRMHVGSIAKTMLATGVLRLVSEGRLALDTPLAQLLPGFVLDNPWDASDPVRLSHLLDHTAGLEDATFRHVFTSDASLDSPLALAFRDRTVVRTRPGSEASYSNLGYVLAAMVIERTVGERYETYLDRTLLRPLGMKASSFSHVDKAAGGPALAMGHVGSAKPQPYLPSYLRPAGQFVTTPRDMARFAAFLMSDGRMAQGEFIRADLLRRMGRPRDTAAAAAGLEVGYALGMRLRDRHGRLGLCHGGNGIGVRAMLCMYPDQRQAFFVGLNMDSETADYEAFNALLLDALAVPRAAMATQGIAAPPVLWDGWYVRLPAKVSAFVYLDMLFNPVAVTAGAGQLQLRPLLGDRVALTPLKAGLYRAPGRVAASHVLLADARGQAWADGTGTWRRVSGWAVTALWASLVSGVAGTLYVLAAGGARLWRARRRFAGDALAPAWFTLLCVPLAGAALGMSWQTMGEIGVASVALAALTAVLPLAALYGLARARQGGARWQRGADMAALAGLLQWCAVLAACGLLPLRIWA
jgi:CubicO group peptidase (beta-lactamase class C family)